MPGAIAIPVSLAAFAGAAVLNFWLSTRVALVRRATQTAHGDGGDALLARRIRAHSNFVEYTPFILLLVLGIELSGKGGWALLAVASVYLLARIAHALGMDGDGVPRGRSIGAGVTFLTLLGLAAWAALIAGGVV